MTHMTVDMIYYNLADLSVHIGIVTDGKWNDVVGRKWNGSRRQCPDPD